MGANKFMSGRHTSDIISHRVQKVAGRGDCSIEVAAFVGRVIYADGESGTYIGVETVGTFDDPGAFKGSAMILLEDGSVSNETFIGTTETSDGAGRFAGTGTWRLEGGTGRFAGLQASGHFKWTLEGDRYQDEFGA